MGGTATSGAALSAQEAFITQFTSAYNPTGPRGSTNCGPASLAMSLAYTGHMPRGLSKEQQVDYARALMSPRREASFTYVQAADGTRVPQLDRDHELTGGTMVSDGVRGAGLAPRYLQGWEALDAQLAAGNPVIANGQTNAAWRSQFPQRMGNGDIGHLNAILGKTQDGRYLVADPLHTGGPVAMTRQQLGVFFSPTGGQPSFTALEGAARSNASPASGAGRGLPDVLARLAQPGVASTRGAQPTGTDTRVSEDVRRLEQALTQGMLPAAQELERLVSANPDPTYQAALAQAARPVLEKMGELYSQPPPELARALGPNPPATIRKDVTQLELNQMLEKNRKAQGETVFSLARTAERLGEPGAAAVGGAFARRMPEGIASGTLGHFAHEAVMSGHGTRLGFAMASEFNTRHPGEARARGMDGMTVMRATWTAINTVRADFSAVADRVQAHNEKLVAMMAGPHAALTPEQRNALVTAYRNAEPQKADFDAIEAKGQLLSSVMPGVSAAAGVAGPSILKDEAGMKALATELPKLAQTRAGSEFIAQELEKRADQKPSFLQWAVESTAGQKDSKDFTDKLSQAIAQSVGLRVVGQLGSKNLDDAKKLLSGLESYAPLFGITQKDMSAFVRQLREFHPNMPLEQARAEAAKLDGLLNKLAPGLPGAPDTVPGQSLRGLGFLIGTAAVINDAKDIRQNGIAENLKLLGDGLSLGADGAALGASVLSRSAFFAAARGTGELLGPVGMALGAAGDAIIAFQDFQDGELLAGSASALQSLGGGIMAAAALAGAGPGTQLLGAGLFLTGLVLKGIDGYVEGQELRADQLKMLSATGPDCKPIIDPALAQALVGLDTQPVLDQLMGRGKMTLPQVQAFLRDYGPVAHEVGGLEVLVKTAGYYRLEGAELPRFLEKIALERHGLSDTQARQVDPATRSRWMNDVALDIIKLEQDARNYATSQRQFDQSKSYDTYFQEHLRASLSDTYPKSVEWAVSQRHRQV
jgi:hypothetical protein